MKIRTSSPGNLRITERSSVLGDIIKEYGRSPNKKNQTAKNLNFFARYIKTPDLYPLLSKMKLAKNPAAYFWSIVKPK